MRAALALLLLAGGGGAAAQPSPAPGWEVRIPDKLEIAAGATAPLTVGVVVDRGLTISRDAAMIVDLTPAAGLVIKRRRLGRADAVDPEADAPRFAPPVRAEAPGDHPVAVHVRFWLCGERTCRPIDVQRTVTVTVTAPAAAP